MRLYVSADIEGIAGVVSRDNLRPGGSGYEEARNWMTQAVVTVCETAHDLGAEEIVVSDSHGNGQNIRFDRMPPYTRLVRSWPRPLGMMQGIEQGQYDGALLIGYHAGASNPEGTLSHTLNGELFQDVRLNGKAASEAVISAAIAGHFGVPVLMVAGDDIAVRETREALGDIAAACLKTSTGWLSAINPSPASADILLRTATQDAIARIGHRTPYRPVTPSVLELRLRTRLVAEWLSYLDDVERLDAYTIRHVASDILGTGRFLSFVSFAKLAVG